MCDIGRTYWATGDAPIDACGRVCCNGGVGDLLRCTRGSVPDESPDRGCLSLDGQDRVSKGLVADPCVLSDPSRCFSRAGIGATLPLIGSGIQVGDWSSVVALRALRGVRGVDLVIVLLRVRPPVAPVGMVRSDGVFDIELAHGLLLLDSVFASIS